MTGHLRLHLCIGVVAGATAGLWASNGRAQEEANTEFEAEHVAAAELILPGLLAEVERDPTALDLLMRLPTPIRSASANVVLSLRGADERRNDACDAVLVYLLKHGETNIRERAAAGLSRGKREIAVPALVAALRDRAPGVRLFACQALMFHEDAGAADAVAALLADEAADVRRTAVRTLGWLDARNKLPEIRRLYEREAAADDAAWVYADCFARLGDEEQALRAARPLLASENWNVRYFVVTALGRVESKQVLPLLMAALPREMELELEHRQAPERTFRKMCEELDRRAETEFGSDAAARMRWWAKNSAAFGVAVEDARPPEGFDDLARRFAEAIAKRDAPRKERAGSYCNLRVTCSPAEAAREPDKQTPWSEPVNGLRARLFAKPRYQQGEDVEVLLMLECTGSKGVMIPGAVVDSIVPYVRPGGPRSRILRPLERVRASKQILAPGAVEMHLVRISPGRALEQAMQEQRIGAPSRHRAAFDTPLRPGKYLFRAVFSPCGVAPDGVGDGVHAEEYPQWKSKQLAAPPIEIEIAAAEE